MAKTATQWRYFLHTLQELPLAEMTVEVMAVLQQIPDKLPTQKSVKKLLVPGRWALVTSGAAIMLFWNGRLVLATGIGVAVMALIYLMQDWRLQVPKSAIKQLLQMLSQPLVMAVAGGSTAMLTTYLAASVWAESDSAWVASGAIVQGLGTLAVLLLLVGQGLSRQSERAQSQFQSLLADLTHADALKRLIAVRTLTRSLMDVDQLAGDHMPGRRRELADCFRLMLHRESENMVREAILDGLQALDKVQALTASTQPVLDPGAARQARPPMPAKGLVPAKGLAKAPARAQRRLPIQ